MDNRVIRNKNATADTMARADLQMSLHVQWQGGKLNTRSPIQSFLRAFRVRFEFNCAVSRGMTLLTLLTALECVRASFLIQDLVELTSPYGKRCAPP